MKAYTFAIALVALFAVASAARLPVGLSEITDEFMQRSGLEVRADS